MSLPYLTSEMAGIGGTIKERPEDFFVQELPLYEPCGTGEHVYCEIEKVGITTFEAIHRLADALNISSRDIGYAGMKDAQAVTRQWFSIQGASEEAVAGLQLPKMTIRSVARHNNKLRLGHLSGNRFAIRIRNVSATDVVKLAPIVEVISRRGLPNYFGEQRFGRRANNDLLGAALIRNDGEELLHLLLGSPDPAIDDPQSLQATKAFDARDNALSMKTWRRRCGMERRILARLMKTGRPSAAIRAVDEKLRRLWVSALQSKLFNEVLARRIGSIDKLMDGDFAWKEENGACFRVEKAESEQARCEAFEISPTGPLVGYRMSLPEGEPLRIEQEVFAAHGLTPGDFRVPGKHKVKGARRPLRVKPRDIDLSGGVDDNGAHVTVAFSMPAGSFATVFLRELMKTETAGEEKTSEESGD